MLAKYTPLPRFQRSAAFKRPPSAERHDLKTKVEDVGEGLHREPAHCAGAWRDDFVRRRLEKEAAERLQQGNGSAWCGRATSTQRVADPRSVDRASEDVIPRLVAALLG